MASLGPSRPDHPIREFVDQAPLAIVVVDAGGQIVLINRETETLFGYSRESILGKPVEVLMPMRFRREHVERREAYVRNPDARDFRAPRELSGLRSDGREIQLEIRLKRIYTAEGPFVFSAIFDLAERGRDERQAGAELADRPLSEAIALARANLDQQQFAYMASHDLQEPLRKMASFSELLEKKYAGQLDADGERYLRYIVESALRMRTMIRDLLDFARLEHQSLKPRMMNFEEIVDTVIENLAVSVEESGAVITRDALPQMPVDGELMAHVVQNLIANAIKFRRPEVPPQVHISAAAEGNFWNIAVRDNGRGIDPAQFEQIFVPFKRLHSHAQIPGTGIGLAICKQIVERHGGSLSVESEPGKGSVFTIRISQTGAPAGEPAAAGPAHAKG